MTVIVEFRAVFTKFKPFHGLPTISGNVAHVRKSDFHSWISFDQLSLRKRLYFFSKTYPIGKSFRKVRKHVDYKEVAL